MPLAGGADHLGVVALDREDRAVDAEIRRLDRVAGCERACERQRLVELPDRTLGARGPLCGGSETPVALRLVPSEPPGLADLRAQRLELRPRLGEVALRVGGGTLALCRGGCLHRLDLGFELSLSLAHVAAQALRLGALRGCRARGHLGDRAASARSDPRRALVDGGPLCCLRLGEQLLDPEPLGCDELASRGDDARIQPQPLCDLECVRRSRPAKRDPVERGVRVRIEAGARVRDALAGARPFLQLRVVRRHERQPRLLGEPRDERLRERGALDRVGPRCELVQQHERPLAGGVQDRDDARDVAREGREAHLDRLPVADVGEHLVEDGQRGRLGGRPQPGLVEERGEAEGLQRHGLAARVRPADHERAQATEVEVDRHRRAWIEQRMARRSQPDLVGDLDGRALPAS